MTTGRSIFYIVLSMLAYTLVYVGSRDVFWTMIWSGVLGYLLSLDWFGYVESLGRFTCYKTLLVVIDVSGN